MCLDPGMALHSSRSQFTSVSSRLVSEFFDVAFRQFVKLVGRLVESGRLRHGSSLDVTVNMGNGFVNTSHVSCDPDPSTLPPPEVSLTRQLPTGCPVDVFTDRIQRRFTRLSHYLRYFGLSQATSAASLTVYIVLGSVVRNVAMTLPPHPPELVTTPAPLEVSDSDSDYSDNDDPPPQRGAEAAAVAAHTQLSSAPNASANGANVAHVLRRGTDSRHDHAVPRSSAMTHGEQLCSAMTLADLHRQRRAHRVQDENRAQFGPVRHNADRVGNVYVQGRTSPYMFGVDRI